MSRKFLEQLIEEAGKGLPLAIQKLIEQRLHKMLDDIVYD